MLHSFSEVMPRVCWQNELSYRTRCKYQSRLLP